MQSKKTLSHLAELSVSYNKMSAVKLRESHLRPVFHNWTTPNISFSNEFLQDRAIYYCSFT